ncbi:MAG: hypothetical protein ACTHLW_05180 [Verrucomicrobiota bacterium]
MKTPLKGFLASVPLGARLLLVAYALGFPLAFLGHYTHTFELYAWLGLANVSSGQVWRMLTYGFLGAGPVDWLVSLFWLATLVSVLGRHWSGIGFWSYCLLGVFSGALPVVLIKPGSGMLITGAAAMIFALLVAWDWFYRRERLLLLGIGEISVRQAAILIALINSIVLFFCSGWFLLLSMWCGGLAGWLYLVIRYKAVMGKTAQQIRSERVARLEL